VHALLLQSQGLTVERPARTTGTLIGVGASALALLLGIALLIKALDWPVSFPQFLAFFGAGLLLPLSLLFAFWAYGCYSLRYAVGQTGLTVGWGTMRHFIPLHSIEKLIPGRGEQRPRPGGLSWWGCHIGRGQADGLGSVLFFSTHRAPEELVYVQTAGAVYALSPPDPERFIAAAQRLQRAQPADAQMGVQASTVSRNLIARHPIWVDGAAQALAIASIAINLALWGFVFAVYPHLSDQITIEFPPVGDITTLASRSDILRVPATASAILGTNLVAALAFQWRERAAAYLLLGGAVFLQLLFWVGALVTVLNA